jgi:hypothetical protein
VALRVRESAVQVRHRCAQGRLPAHGLGMSNPAWPTRWAGRQRVSLGMGQHARGSKERSAPCCLRPPVENALARGIRPRTLCPSQPVLASAPQASAPRAHVALICFCALHWGSSRRSPVSMELAELLAFSPHPLPSQLGPALCRGLQAQRG